MTLWLRFEAAGAKHFGTLDGDTVTVWRGDMFFQPAEIVSRISHDMTLEPGDIIACGTSVGAGDLREGDTVGMAIDGVGRLVNRFA